MAPGPLLATIVDTVTGPDGSGLAGCSDDQLMGIISAARRMESRAAWTLMAAIAEYAARHTGSRPADEFAADELAYELHLTPLSAAGQMDYASTVAARLPQTFAALAAGQIHRCTCGSSRTRPVSCPARTPRRPMRSSPSKRRA